MVDADILEPLLAVAFRQKRKTIANNLKTHVANYAECLATAGIESVRRAETLTMDEWKQLALAVAKK